MIFKLTKRQQIFLNEIKKFNYTKDEAIAEIVNNKRRFDHYSELEKVIVFFFGDD